uniref:Myb-like domain-containing protein n=1 Tax=Alexandrium catenella TaxID=2925 RepID=A0A7S1WD46_ALECA
MVPQGDRAQLMLALLGAVRRISNELLPPRESRKPTDIVSNTDGSITTVGDSPDLPEALPRAEPPLGGSPWSRAARQQPQRAAAEGPYSRPKAERPSTSGVVAAVPAAAREPAGAILCAQGVKVPAVAPASLEGPGAAGQMLFDAPLLDFQDPREPSAPSVPVVRSAAMPDLLGTQGTVPTPRDIIPMRRGHSPWSEEEEVRLIEGYRRYGSAWERIRVTCDLSHRKGTQLREKWRNLVKAGVTI